MINTILFSIMVGAFISYVAYIWIKYGVQKSISDSYNVLPDKHKFLFVLFTWFFAFPAMILGNSLLMLFAGGGIVWVGGNAQIKKKPTLKIHMISAVGGMILGAIAMIFQYHMWYLVPIILLGMAISYKLDKEHFFWWTELLIFSAITVAIGTDKI